MLGDTNTDISAIPYHLRYKTDENKHRWILLEEAKTCIASATRELKEKLDSERSENACQWLLDDPSDEDDRLWATSCGEMFQLVDGTPEDNRLRHCAYCGGKLEVVIDARRIEPQ